jgi:hypothetical protein
VSTIELEGGRWRLTIHHRPYSVPMFARDTGIAELTDARSRRLEFALNTPAKLTFSIDGESPAAVFLQELTTEVMAWRTDDDGAAELMFRGVVTQSQDTLSEQVYTVNYTCLDYLALVNRRFLTAPVDLNFAQVDQDDIVASLLALASEGCTAGDGTSFAPGSALPLTRALVDPNGGPRGQPSGVLRDRTYPGQTALGQAITDLGACIGGYDTDVDPAAESDGTDYLRIFYPAQGIARPDLVLAYGSSVSTVSRSVNSTEYANYRRVIGNTTEQGASQVYAERWNDDANDVGRLPVGLWMGADNASDVSVQTTLQQKADGELERSGVLVPSYTLGIRPDWWSPGEPAMGDTVPLVIRKGRLDVSTTVRILAINYAIGDDGTEDVEVTVGRPALTLTALFRDVQRDVNALARR